MGTYPFRVSLTAVMECRNRKWSAGIEDGMKWWNGIFLSNNYRATHSIVGIYLDILGTYKYSYQEMPQEV